MKRVLVTGANRGIGLELAKRFAGRGDSVIAACRRSSKELDALGVTVRDGVDVTDGPAIETLTASIGDDPLDLLVNNAGILDRDSLDALDLDAVRRQVEVNALAPLRLTHSLLARMAKGSKVAMITSLMGSMGDNTSGGYYGYRMSKAALNSASVSLARDLASRGIAVGVFHPGMVATEMTGGRGISVGESAKGLLARIDELSMDSSGTFRHSDGRELPW